MKTKYVLGLAFLASVLPACGTAYLGAAADFADATSQSRSAMTTVVASAQDMCVMRTQINYLVHRLKGQKAPDGKLVRLDTYAESFSVTLTDKTSFTWAAHCEALKKSDAVALKAIGSLGAYGDALKTVTKHDFSGKSASDTTKDFSDLLPLIGASGEAGKAAGTLKDPMGKLAGALAKACAEGKIAKVVDVADGPVTAILAALGKYVKAVQSELEDAKQMLGIALGVAESLVKEDDAAGTLVFFEEAKRLREQLGDYEEQLSAAGDALDKLSKAETKLAAAKGDNDSPELPEVLGLVSEVLADISAFRDGLKKEGK